MPCVPIEILGAGQREGAALSVVDDVGRPESGAGGQEIEAHPPLPRRNAGRVDAVTSKRTSGSVAQGIGGHPADYRRVVAEPRQPHRHIGLSPADMDVEPPALQQQLPPRCGQAQQQLAETDDLASHASLLFGGSNPSPQKLVTGFRRAAASRTLRVGPGILCRRMAWFALVLSFLIQASAPAAPAPASVPAPRAAVPVRPRPWPETGPSTVYFALGSARVEGEGIAVVRRMAEDYRQNGRVTVEILANADNSGSQASNRSLTQRRARAVADALVSNGIPRAVIVLRPVGEDEPQVMTPDGVPDPFNRYARIIFPVPPPAN